MKSCDLIWFISCEYHANVFAGYSYNFHENYFSHGSCEEVFVSKSFKNMQNSHEMLHGFRIRSKLMQIILATFACILSFAGFIQELLLIQKIYIKNIKINLKR